MKLPNSIGDLPGSALVLQGLADFQAGRRTIPGCLVQVAKGRLTLAGLLLQRSGDILPDPELQLYRLLRAEGGDAYSRYNALIRELVSFEQALDRVIRPLTPPEHRPLWLLLVKRQLGEAGG